MSSLPAFDQRPCDPAHLDAAVSLRAKAAQHRALGRSARSLREGSHHRRTARSYAALAENADWLAGRTPPARA